MMLRLFQVFRTSASQLGWRASIAPSARFQSTSRRRVPPPPTWSLKDLKLSSSSNQESLPTDEAVEVMDRLAQRACLPVEEDKEELAQELAKMMTMISQVQEESKTPFSFPDDKPTDYYYYDAVRGVEKAPLRDKEVGDDLEESQEDADSVWNKWIKPKTIRKGGNHHYFTITTKVKKRTD